MSILKEWREDQERKIQEHKRLVSEFAEKVESSLFSAGFTTIKWFNRKEDGKFSVFYATHKDHGIVKVTVTYKGGMTLEKV